MNFVVHYFNELYFLLGEMSFYLLLGFLFAGILHVYIRAHRVSGFMGKKDLRSVTNASLLGVPLPLCSCGVIPTGLSFFKNGASKGSTVSFLISTPQTGIDSIMVTYSLLGLPFAIIRPIIAFFTGIVGGIFTNLSESKDIITTTKLDQIKADKPASGSLKEVFRYGFVEFLKDISKWLTIGLLIAALLAILIPDNFFAEHGGSGIIGMLIVLAGSIPLYVCATGSVPIAAVLMLKGLSPGAALVFLMAGPATNIATITVLNQILGKRTTVIYLLTIITGALISGLFIDQFLPSAWFDIAGLTESHAHHFLPNWLKLISTITLIILLLNGLYQRYKPQNRKEMKTTNKDVAIKTFHVQGMSCPHCKANVENGLKKINGIEHVAVDLKSGKVEITGQQINMDDVKESVESGGYVFKEEDN